MPQYGIHWQMTNSLRQRLDDGGVGMVTEQLLSSAAGVGAIVKEGAVADLQWYELDEQTAPMMNASLAARLEHPEMIPIICCFEAGDWMVRATIEVENGPG